MFVKPRTAIVRGISTLALAGGAITLLSQPAEACSAEQFIGGICIMASNYCPENFLPADGRTLQATQNPALYSVIGNVYGGVPNQTFNLPDLRSRMPVGATVSAPPPPPLSPLKVGLQRGSEQIVQGVSAGENTTVVSPQLALTYCIAISGPYPPRP